MRIKDILAKNGAKIYFIGIGGIAMSGAAGIARAFGYEVLGSDSKEIYNPAKKVLDQNRISYFEGYNKVQADKAKADLYILSAGEDLRNPEVKYVYDNNLPHASFAELLGSITGDSLRLVVAGTHGKSTTAGLLGHLLKNLEESSFLTGAVLQNYETNFYKGDGHYFVFEGDEYKSEFDDPTPKFVYYKPDILVLTNLEYDHPDLFENFESLESEFKNLIASLPEDGLIVYNADDPHLPKLVYGSNVASVSFGIDNDADFKAEHLEYSGDFISIEVNNKNSKKPASKLTGTNEFYKTQLPGRINVYNNLAAIATLRTLGFGQEQIALDLLSFKGIKRRFEIVAKKNGIILIDDYAHHPTAVKETLDAARLKYPKAIIWAVFEPHTFSRTKATLPDLKSAFEKADEVLISEIYPARESAKDATIASKEVVKEIVKHNTKYLIHNTVRLVQDKKQALEILKSEAKPGDVVIVMAVGSFNRLAYELLEVL